MNSDIEELMTSSLPLPSAHLCLDSLLMSQGARKFSRNMPGNPVAVCNSLACSSLKPSSQQTLELLQDLLGMPESQQKEHCKAGVPKCPGGNLNGTGKPDGDRAQQQFLHRPMTESAGFGGLPRSTTNDQTSSASRLPDGDYLAACLLAPQVLGSDVEELEACLTHAEFFTGCKHNTSLKEAKTDLLQGDVVAQPVLKLLLMKQRETSSLVRLREVETLQLRERLRMEQRKNAHLAVGFEQVCEALNAKLSLTESGSENLAGQLQALMEKYGRLRKRATSTKRSLLQEVKEREQIQTRLKEAQREKEELDAKQRLIREQKEAVLQELSIFRRKLQAAEQQGGEAVRQKEALEEAVSKLKGEVECLTLELAKTQRESKRLVKSARSRDFEREAGLKTLQELQDTVRSLYARLERSSTEKQAVLAEMEAVKQEAKLLHNRQRVELLQLQEEHKGCGERDQSQRREANALAKVVSDLKQDKLTLEEEVEAMQRERGKTERSGAEERQRLREAVCALEKERQALLAEMEVLKQDYIALSDRITQRMALVEQEEDGPMSIAEVALVRQADTERRVQEHSSSMGPVVNKDVATQVRRKPQAEERQSWRS